MQSRDSTGARQLAVLDEVSSGRVTSQRNAGRQLELVKTRMSTLLDAGGASRDVANGADRPASRTRQDQPGPRAASLWARTVGSLPVMRGNALMRALKKVALRYESASKQIVVIETKLAQGGTLLARDNVELRRLYEDVETQQEAIHRQIFLGELLLGSSIARTTTRPSRWSATASRPPSTTSPCECRICGPCRRCTSSTSSASS